MTDYSSSYSSPHENFNNSNILDLPSINCYHPSSLSSCPSTPNSNTLQSSQIYHLNSNASFGNQVHSQLQQSNTYRAAYETNWRNLTNVNSPIENITNAGNQSSVDTNSTFNNSFHSGFGYKLYSPPISDTDQNSFIVNQNEQRANSISSSTSQFTSLIESAGVSNADKRKQRRIRTTFSSLQLKELEKGTSLHLKVHSFMIL